jgi:hypothetical protein
MQENYIWGVVVLCVCLFPLVCYAGYYFHSYCSSLKAAHSNGQVEMSADVDAWKYSVEATERQRAERERAAREEAREYALARAAEARERQRAAIAEDQRNLPPCVVRAKVVLVEKPPPPKGKHKAGDHVSAAKGAGAGALV